MWEREHGVLLDDPRGNLVTAHVTSNCRPSALPGLSICSIQVCHTCIYVHEYIIYLNSVLLLMNSQLLLNIYIFSKLWNRLQQRMYR